MKRLRNLLVFLVLVVGITGCGDTPHRDTSTSPPVVTPERSVETHPAIQESESEEAIQKSEEAEEAAKEAEEKAEEAQTEAEEAKQKIEERE